MNEQAQGQWWFLGEWSGGDSQCPKRLVREQSYPGSLLGRRGIELRGTRLQQAEVGEDPRLPPCSEPESGQHVC